MNNKRAMFAVVPIALEYPDEMAADIRDVLGGEYEAGYDGEQLVVVDIGANVGAFTIWAGLRWPNSIIHAYEPNPGTFRMLQNNVGHLPNVTCHPQAVYPGNTTHRMLYSRFPGDGESGLTDYIGRTFESLPEERVVPVPVVSPAALPACDVLKIDVEGGEATILEAMDLSTVSLILLEYQDMRNRRAIEQRLRDGFACEFVDRYPWSRLLPRAGYRADLAGDSFGHLFFSNTRANRLRRTADSVSVDGVNKPLQPGSLSLRQVLAVLPGAVRRTLASRLRKPC